MASGLPTVAFGSAVGGLLVRDGVHLLVAEPSVRGLLEATERLAADRALALRIGGSARALVVERYDWRRIARRLDDALETAFQPAPYENIEDR